VVFIISHFPFFFFRSRTQDTGLDQPNPRRDVVSFVLCYLTVVVNMVKAMRSRIESTTGPSGRFAGLIHG